MKNSKNPPARIWEKTYQLLSEIKTEYGLTYVAAIHKAVQLLKNDLDKRYEEKGQLEGASEMDGD